PSAVNAYLQAIKVAPECPLAYNYLGTTYRTQGSLNKAREQYLKAIELDPSYASAYMNLAINYLYMGKLTESIDYQRRAIALNPNYPDSYYYLGLALDKTNSPTEAMKNYQTFLNLVGTQERYYTFIQSAKENMGRLYDAANGVGQ